MPLDSKLPRVPRIQSITNWAISLALPLRWSLFQGRLPSFALTRTDQRFNLRAWGVHQHSIKVDFTHASSPRMTIKNQNNKKHKIVP
jgi:hypothetical protein